MALHEYCNQLKWPNAMQIPLVIAVSVWNVALLTRFFLHAFKMYSANADALYRQQLVSRWCVLATELVSR